MSGFSNASKATGIFRFAVPDLSVGPEERGLFSPPASKSVEEYELELHDARTDPSIIAGSAGLDAQGFTYLNHNSNLADGDKWFDGTNIEDIYFPEVCDLICELTGARAAVVLDCAFRRRLADKQADPSHYNKNGCELDQELGKLPKDRPLVYGRDAAGSLEPARMVHIDYTNKGLRNTARYRRKDICRMAAKILEVEDETAQVKDLQVPRYASFSVWRPIDTVQRDPLAVCDARTVDIDSDYVDVSYRAISDVTNSGEYQLEASVVLPPKFPEKQRWYWLPEQQSNEVLIVKFADTRAERDRNIARGSPHCSPTIPGTEDKQTRCSIEVRVLAVWE